MQPDSDDTVVKAPRLAPRSTHVDLDDTVARGTVPSGPPPALVEPPAPERRLAPPDLGGIDARSLVSEPPAEEPVTAGTVEEPVYTAVLADGTEIAIDAPVLVGRRPSRPRIHSGPEPRLVTLDSPTRELSATHLELRVVGGALVASDMRSTNGTVVQLPGTAPRTLIRGESAVVVGGTRIDLGDGAVLDILDPRRSERS